MKIVQPPVELKPETRQPSVKPLPAEPLPAEPAGRDNPLGEVRDLIETIRVDAAVDPREYLDEIRVLLGAE